MSSRASFRRKMVLPVTVIRHGGDERQLAHTLDLTSTSARLGGLVSLLEAGEAIEIQRGAAKAKFQVVWMGIPGGAMAGQAGIRAADSHCDIWDVNLPEDETDTKMDVDHLRQAIPAVQSSSQFPGERRWHPRYACNGKASVKTAGAVYAINGEVKDVSKGGVYIEVSAPLPVNSNVTMTLCVEDIHFEAAGLVRTSYPLLGMGICFQNLTPHDTEKVAVVVERARRKAPAQKEAALAQSNALPDSATPVAARPSGAVPTEENQTRTLVQLCRKLAEDFDRWKLTCPPTEVEDLKLAIHELDAKLSPAGPGGFIDYSPVPASTSKLV